MASAPSGLTDLKEAIDAEKLPQHVAVIMDGNGRWAKQRGAARIYGHRNALQAVRDTAEGCAELGVRFLTLYAFSTENWQRPAAEVNALMQLLVSTIRKETKTLMDNDIRLAALGDTSLLPDRCQRELREAIALTSGNRRMTLHLALNYSGRWEILQAVRQIAEKIEKKELSAQQVQEELFVQFLNTRHVPDPELLIRTSGEMRISNFLLWQLAYTELYITDTLWPDFRREDLYRALIAYQKRERRFGKVG